jgi:hypothetical protein
MLEEDSTVKRSPMDGSANFGSLNSTRILGLMPLGTAGVGDRKSKMGEFYLENNWGSNQ